MKVRVSTLPLSGMTIDDTLPLDALNERMSLGRGDETRFLAAPRVTVQLSPSRHGATLSGTITASLRQSCSLCADGVEHPITVEVACQLLERNDDSLEDDVGTHYYENDAVDLEPILQEYLILSLSPFWHPELDKGGRCTFCKRSPEDRRRATATGGGDGPQPARGSGESLGSLISQVLKQGKN